MEREYEQLKDKYFNKKFIIQYVFIFLALNIFCSFVQFLGNPIVLLILTFGITAYLQK